MSAAALTWAWRQMPAVTSTPARLVLVALADRADDDGELWPKVEWVAEKVALGKSTVRKHIAALEDAGLLKREERARPTDGGQTSNLLRLALGTEWGGRSEPSGDPRSELGGQETTKKETTKISNSDPRAEEVHAYYLERRGLGARKLAAGTEKQLVRAFNSGFNVLDLKLAVDGLLGSDWHREHGQQTLSTIFKTGPGTEGFEDRIQGFIDRALRDQPNGNGMTAANVPDWVLRNLRVYGEHGHDDAQARSMGTTALNVLEQRGLRAVWNRDELPARLVRIEGMS